MREFSKETQEQLGHYVYGLIDPRNGRYFYIGKGQGNRVFQHLKVAIKDAKESDKIAKIREILNGQLEIPHIIIRHGLSDEEASIVEATLIDFYGKENLTNEVNGANTSDYGIANAKTLEQRYSCKEFAESKDTPPFIMIKIREDILRERENSNYYETCRSAWKVSPEKVKGYKYALCVLDGIVREVYEIEKWQECRGRVGRYEFVGKVAQENIRAQFVGFRIPSKYRKKGMASPVLYSSDK